MRLWPLIVWFIGDVGANAINKRYTRRIRSKTLALTYSRQICQRLVSQPISDANDLRTSPQPLAVGLGSARNFRHVLRALAEI